MIILRGNHAGKGGDGLGADWAGWLERSPLWPEEVFAIIRHHIQSSPESMRRAKRAAWLEIWPLLPKEGFAVNTAPHPKSP